MRLIVLVILVAGCREAPLPLPDARTSWPDAAPLPTTPPPPLAPVAGASAEAGKEVFARACAGCHGADGRTPGPGAADLRRGPTDLGRTGYLCRTTLGEPAVPADVDIDAALDHGSHAGRFTLDPAQRRSVVLHVKSLAPGFAAPPQPQLEVPARLAGDAQRGRVLYLTFGCWVCHGTGGDGDGSATQSLAWGGKKLERLPALSEHAAFVCGAEPERLFRTLALGMGDGPTIMPPHLAFAEKLARPKDIDSPEWKSRLMGKVSDDEVAKVRDFYRSLPELGEARRASPEARRARAAGYLWDLVAYVQSANKKVPPTRSR